MHPRGSATIVSMHIVKKLIKDFEPSKYKLSLSIDRINRKIDGNVIIYGTSKINSNNITLHSKDLNIKSIKINDKITEFSFGENDTLIIGNTSIANQEYVININFDGEITDAMHGIYPCYYNHTGVKKELIATQFESHHAREVFPCIDEPAAKATYDVTLITENDVTVIGNMPIQSQEVKNSHLVTTFDTTPIMSSYLLAWVVGEMHRKTAHTKNGVEVNVWATPAQTSESLDFALDIAVRSIEFFDEYFDTPYPLPKSDHVALPDFSSGAMENWGLVTYREIALLVDPKNTSISTKQYVATVIAHELSHQWFGNLVTMEWWNDLWLNESFATLMEYIAVDAMEPEWKSWLDFASNDCVMALRRDSLDGVQPVQIDVNHPDEISTLFDGAIVYAKGARLLQMLQNYIGEKAFQTGLKEYFKKFAYQNTEAADLWKCLGESSGKDIESFMNTWISQPGFPVLHATLDGDKLSLSQEKLTNKLTKKSDTLWPITLNSNCADVPEILDQKSITIEMNTDVAIRFNIGNYAHFITHYDHELLARIIQQLKSGELSIIDRLRLINEQLILANAGIISNAEYIPIIESLKHETSESVWGIISLAINSLHKIVENDPETEHKLREFAGNIARTQYEKLGFVEIAGESENDIKLRQIIVSLMLYAEDKSAISKAMQLYELSKVEDLDPELRSLILSTVVKHNFSNELFNSLIELYKSTNSTELQQDIRSGLTGAKDQEAINKLLEMVCDKSFIRTQDASSWIIYLMRSKHARVRTWQWLRDNWQWIKDTFSGDKSYDCFPRYSATTLSTTAQLQEYKDFFEPKASDPSLTRVIHIGINEIENRVDSISRDFDLVKQALADKPNL